MGRCMSSKEIGWNMSEPKLWASQKSTNTVEKSHREGQEKRGDRLLVTLHVGHMPVFSKGRMIQPAA